MSKFEEFPWGLKNLNNILFENRMGNIELTAGVSIVHGFSKLSDLHLTPDKFKTMAYNSVLPMAVNEGRVTMTPSQSRLLTVSEIIEPKPVTVNNDRLLNEAPKGDGNEGFNYPGDGTNAFIPNTKDKRQEGPKPSIADIIEVVESKTPSVDPLVNNPGVEGSSASDAKLLEEAGGAITKPTPDTNKVEAKVTPVAPQAASPNKSRSRSKK